MRAGRSGASSRDVGLDLLERGPQLAELRARLADARRSGGQLVVVSGEAGIGKTSLLEAFTASLPRTTGVLRGICDPVVPPRPFAPIVDIARQLHDGLRDALASADREQVIDRFLMTVRAQGSASVVMLEDLHWADSATLDLLRVVGRRLTDLSTLIVGSYRGDEVGARHPLRLMLGDLPARLVSELILPPLSVEAVGMLAGVPARDAARLHQATGGNPFFVTEVLASGGEALPATVRDAVGARVARLSPAGQRVVEAAAVLGPRAERSMVGAVVQGAAASVGIRESLERRVLEDRDGRLGFRHELARDAVLDALAPDERARLHQRALVALRSGVADADPVRLAQHAIEAGDAEAILELAPLAASQAAELGAHIEAADYLSVALALSDGLDPRARADLLERYAYECSVSDRVAASRSAQEAALDIWRRLGDTAAEGSGLRALSTYMWLGGEGNRAREVAELAVAVLEGIEPRGVALAAAYAKLAQLLMNATQDDDRSRMLAAKALDLADRLGDEPIAVHALTTLAALETVRDEATLWNHLEEALRRARAANLAEDVIRILINYVESARDLRRYDVAERYGAEAIAFLKDHEFELYRHLLLARMAQISLERGRWADAERGASALLSGGAVSSQVKGRALEVLGRLRARRGEPGARLALDDAMATVGPGELQEILPLHAARAEAAWLGGDLETVGTEATRGVDLGRPVGPAFFISELSFWAWRSGRTDRLPEGTEAPYVLQAAGRHRDAADAWAAIGRPYDQAAALADSDAEADLRDALAILRSLDARVLADRVERRLRERGARGLPRGPRPSTRAHPAGLTDREMDVLGLVRRGASNADIARRLVISPKTVDHHVSAVLRKLGVPDRAAARREAERLGLQDGEPAHPD